MYLICFVKDFTNKYYRIILILLFIAFLIIGMLSVTDYGIATDERMQHDLGINALNLVIKNDRVMYDIENKFHGTAFTIVLASVEKIFNITKIRTVFLLRHYITFLFFYISVIFFYFLCRNIFKSWKLGFLGSVFLILSPRIFADSFYNPKDLPFLSAFIISIFTLERCLEKKNIGFASLHGLVTGFATGIRIIGILIPVFTILLLIIEIAIQRKQTVDTRGFDKSRLARNLLIYLFVTTSALLFFMPALMPNPVGYFLETIKVMSDYPHGSVGLYMGKIIYASNLPWHYLPVNIAIMTPVLYTLLFILGLGYFFVRFKKNIRDFYFENKYIIISILWFFIPVLGVILLRSNLYNGWRQMYFIWPAFLILSLNGVKFIYDFLIKKIKLKYYFISVILVTGIIVFNQLFIAQLMVRQHPYEYAYYNILAGKNMEEVKKRFIIDYWGLTFKDGIDYVLKTDKRARVTYTTGPGPTGASEFLLSEQDKKRIVWVEDFNDADYYLNNFRKTDYEFLSSYDEVYNITLNGGKIMSVYKLKK